jgi:PD-(D/E)XK nuclease superfamily
VSAVVETTDPMAELAALLASPPPSPNGTTSGGGRPAAYRTKDGKRVPGTTTITGRFKEAGGLIHWAWEQGIAGVDYRKTRDEAGDKGHLAHELIDADIHGRDPEIPDDVDPEILARAEQGFASFRAWRSQVHLEIVDTERPLISEIHRFGGTYDAIARINGATALLDWKSGAGIYQDHVVQLAAYRALIRERNPHDAPADAYILRVGKDWGDFHYHSIPSSALDLAWRAFLLMRELFELDKPLKGLVR